MTKTFSLNANNDLYVGLDGNLAMSNGIEAVKFLCETACKAQKGEMPLNVDGGIPNFQVVWVGVPNLLQFEAAIRATIQQVSGVNQVLNYKSSVIDGNLVYQVKILTNFGSAVVNGGITIAV